MPGGIKRVTPRAYDADGIRSLVEDHVKAASSSPEAGSTG